MRSVIVTVKSLTSGVASLTTQTPNYFLSGQYVRIAGVDSTFDGNYVLIGASGTSLSYAKAAPDVSSSAATGTASDIQVYGAPTTLDAIMDAIGKRVVAKRTRLSADTVFETLAPDESHITKPQSDTFLTIRPQTFPVGTGLVVGGGRQSTTFEGQFRLALFTRLGSDQDLRDARQLKAATRGLIAQVTAIVNSLQLFIPMNGDGDCILKEPMRVRTFSFLPRKVAESSWSVCESFWEAKFVLAIDDTELVAVPGT